MPPRQRTRPQAQQKDNGLKLDDAHAIAILEKAVEYEVLDEDKLPDNKRQRIAAAAEQIDLLIEAWNNGINPDSDSEEKAEMGQAIQDILDLAGIEIDGDGNVTYGDLPDLDASQDGDDDQADDDQPQGDGEAAVDINDVIDGYDDLSAAGKVKAIKALELDMEDDDDYNQAVAIYEYEEAQDQPSSRVLSYLDEMLPQDGEGGGEAEEDDDDDESAEQAGDDAEGGEWQQPWTKADGAPGDYDKMTAAEIKKYLDKMLARDELSVEMLDYVSDYEEQREKPPTRTRILKHIEALRAQFEGGEAPAEEEPEERSGRPVAAQRSRSGGKLAAMSQQQEEEEPQTSGESGVFVISTNGDEPYTAYGVFQAAGIVADLLSSGAESVNVEAG